MRIEYTRYKGCFLATALSFTGSMLSALIVMFTIIELLAMTKEGEVVPGIITAVIFIAFALLIELIFIKLAEIVAKHHYKRMLQKQRRK